ncbi:hypothetical protein BGZ60DRAFT_396255 [Tricladium varicosporioides]|nr:hypothetical protein BGZ60DRAFT_396255 [Hymenoscyphus varicosporioides]
MAQGGIKSKKNTAPTAKSTGRRQTVLGPKKGARTIAPRKQVLVRNARMTKVCRSIAIFLLRVCTTPLGVRQSRRYLGTRILGEEN